MSNLKIRYRQVVVVANELVAVSGHWDCCSEPLVVRHYIDYFVNWNWTKKKNSQINWNALKIPSRMYTLCAWPKRQCRHSLISSMPKYLHILYFSDMRCFGYHSKDSCKYSTLSYYSCWLGFHTFAYGESTDMFRGRCPSYYTLIYSP